MKKMMGIDYCLEWGAHLARMKLGREGEWGREEIWMGVVLLLFEVEQNWNLSSGRRSWSVKYTLI